MKYIKLFEDYSETGENPSEITIRVTEKFVKEFELSLDPHIGDALSTKALPGKPGVTLTKGRTKFIGLTNEHEEWWKDNSRSVGEKDDLRVVSNKVKIDHILWFAKYDPVIGEVSLYGVHAETYDADRKITELLDTIIRNSNFDVSHLIKFGEGKNDMKMYRSLNCIFRERFEEGSVDKDGYVEIVSLK